MRLLKNQQLVASDHLNTTLFLEGTVGTGKTTAAIERVKQLLKAGVPAEAILLLVPQATLAQPYKEALRRARLKNSVNIQTATIGSLAYQAIDLFWPLIADDAQFADPLDRPHFLSLELIQYYMKRFIGEEIQRRDYFNSVRVNPNRLYTQIVDNLNKAALVGFAYDEIGARLKAAWRGDAEQMFIYDDAQACATLFRQICLDKTLLDFSLQVELFIGHLWKLEQPRRYFTRQYRHLIVDNLEEDNPATHELLADWLKDCDSALLIYDSEGGYRRFLGADPINAYLLKDQCEIHVMLDKTRVMSEPLEAFHAELAHSLDQRPAPRTSTDARAAIAYADHRYLPQMVEWTVENIAALIADHGVPPREIVILSAFLPDALRFSLQTRLDDRGIPHRSQRPSRALREEPAARALLTFAKLAHPQWTLLPSKFDVAFALTAAIGDLDLVRARLITEILFRKGALMPFTQIQDIKVQERITFELANRYEVLRAWLDGYQAGEKLPVDLFFSKLFGEVLSQPAFAFHGQFDAANTTANLIDSARDFRMTLERIEPELDIAKEYIQMVDSGVIANQYPLSRRDADENAVLIAPAYAFLMTNTPVDYQFWLNIGSTGWGQRLYQPLTQPYVLSRQWVMGQQWTDEDEVRTNQAAVYQLVSGLIRRCRKGIYLGFSQYGEQGYEQRGALLMAVQRMLRRLAKEAGDVQTTS